MSTPSTSRPKKSPPSKAWRKSPAGPRYRAAQTRRKRVASSLRLEHRAAGPTLQLRREARAWRASPPTALERETMLVPQWMAESVVQEVEWFLKAALPDHFAGRLAARAHYLYPRHKHFHKGLNRPGNRGRESLLMFMRHWTAGWLKRERNPLHKKLPCSFGMGQRLPDQAHSAR